MTGPLRFTNFNKTAEHLATKFHRHLRLATPLGLGKPNQLLNEIYEAFRIRPEGRLDIFTALSLRIPEPKVSMEKRFALPFIQRHFGQDYPHLQYVKDGHSAPENINIYEFYFQAGQEIGHERMQRNYSSINYTHVAQSLLRGQIDAAVQLIAKHPTKNSYSLSCNPDVTIDVADLYRKAGKTLYMVGVVHPDLPYMEGEAEVGEDFFNVIVDSPEIQQELFALPKEPVDTASFMIGFHASQVVQDDGTLQIGIGSLADGLVHSLILRQKKNDLYKNLARKWWSERGSDSRFEFLQWDTFEHGLYGTSELIFDGFMHLRRNDVLKRLVSDKGGPELFLNGAFYLGSKEFYQWLRDLPPQERSRIAMSPVSKINDLYDENEMALRRQRKNARFFNSAMGITLLGETISDTLPTGQVVSGVGGQYNFVAMSHEMPDARSIIMLKSTRGHGRTRQSNIVWSQGPVTLPRHLRDLVVTEYGIANLLYKTDEEVIKSLIEISDAEFQEDLITKAQQKKKLSRHYRIPSSARFNRPEALEKFLDESRERGAFPLFPFGSDFTDIEMQVYHRLMRLKKKASPLQRVQQLFKGITQSPQQHSAELERMDLLRPSSLMSWVEQKIFLGG